MCTWSRKRNPQPRSCATSAAIPARKPGSGLTECSVTVACSCGKTYSERKEQTNVFKTNVPATNVRAYEIWSYVGKKESNKGHGDTREVGDAWTFIAIERNTKLVLAYELGKRTVSSASRFIGKLAIATDPITRFQLTTDGLSAYPFPVGNILGDRVDYGQLIKIYNAATAEEQRRYSPARIAEAKKTDVYGDPDFDLICTSHIERMNGSMRQWCKRLTRLTYAFSKSGTTWMRPWRSTSLTTTFAAFTKRLSRLPRWLRDSRIMSGQLWNCWGRRESLRR